MSVNYSTGLKIAMTGTVGLKGALDNSVVELRSGARPLTADLAATGSLLATISTNGDGSGVYFLAPDATGLLAKDNAVVWRGLAVLDGTVGYARFKHATDVAGNSATAYRADFTVAVSGGDMSISSLSTTASPASPHSIDQASFSF